MKSKEARNTEKLLAQIGSSEKILESNKKQILNFYNERIMTGTKPESMVYPLRIMFLLGRGTNKPFKTLAKEDLQKFFAELKPAPHNITGRAEAKYSPRTMWSYMAYTKTFWKWLFDMQEGEGYPKAVRWIKRPSGELPRKRPIHILTREEVLAMIKTANNPRDKAIIAILFETGLRSKELLWMKYDDLNHNETHCMFEVVGKANRKRTVMLEWSYPYLKEWLAFMENNKHMVKEPYREFIWISFPCRGVSRTKSKIADGRSIDRDTLRTILKTVAERAGIKKRVWNHGFRHSSATDFVKQGYNEAELRLKYGWSKKSTIPHEYTHYDFDELTKKMLAKSGKAPDEEKKNKEVLKTKKCLYCGTDCGAESTYCMKCGNSLNFQKPVERRDEKGLAFTQELIDKLNEFEKNGLDLRQFNRFMETWVKTNSK